jgi:hypothetical protein
MVRVALGTFAYREIRARFGGDLAAGVQTTLEHYARRLKSGRKPVEFPRFRRGHQAEAVAAKVELLVEPGIWETLEREARRGGVSVEQLAVHAVFVCLADLDRADEEKLAGFRPGKSTLHTKL